MKITDKIKSLFGLVKKVEPIEKQYYKYRVKINVQNNNVKNMPPNILMEKNGKI